MSTIEINGVKFAPSASAMVSSLFTAGGTASGYYKATKAGVILYNAQGERIGGVNRHGVIYGSSRVNGKLWHSYAMPKGIPEFQRYSQQGECAASILRQFGIEVSR